MSDQHWEGVQWHLTIHRLLIQHLFIQGTSIPFALGLHNRKCDNSSQSIKIPNVKHIGYYTRMVNGECLIAS